MEKKDIKLFYEQSARKTPHSSYYLSKNKGVRWLFNKMAEILDKALAEIVKDLSDLRILDVGCGDGNLTKKLEKYGNVTALDISIVRLKRSADLMSRGEIMMGDAETLPFKKHSFDLILCSSTLDHLLEPKKAVLEMKRVIKKNGYMLLIIDNYLIKTKRNIDALGHFSPLNFW
ncbi:MAG: class I SAM-dependent methyltransferase, partial [Methanobacteriota archaeon]